MKIPVLVAKQANKLILTGSLSGAEYVTALRAENFGVNAEAQRSLARGADKDTTAELLESDRVENTPRMKSFISFSHRVMQQTERGKNIEGFLGAVQLVIPENFKGAKLHTVGTGGSGTQDGFQYL